MNGELRIVATDSLHLHAAVEPERVRRVARQLWSLGCQQHPVLATPVAGRWLVLDGHHRASALRGAGIAGTLVQHVELDESVLIGAWAHELAGEPVAAPDSRPWGGLVARVRTPHGCQEVRYAGTDLRGRVTAMWRLAGRYADRPYRRVTRQAPWARGAGCRVEYTALTANDCLLLMEYGLTLPPGVSRFQVAGRVLDVRVPLARLVAGPRASRPDPGLRRAA